MSRLCAVTKEVQLGSDPWCREGPSDTRSGDIMVREDTRGLSSKAAMHDGSWGKSIVTVCGASAVSEWSGFGRRGSYSHLQSIEL